MSWCINLIGSPEKVEQAIESYSSELSDLSKAEFDEAKPGLISLIKQNYGDEGQFVKLEANGHGHIANGKESRQLSVSLTPLYGEFVG